MKRLAVSLMLTAGFVVAASPAWTQSKSAAGFDKLKTLVGQWQGQKSDGKPVTMTYELVSNGSSLMETIEPGGEENMVTMYLAEGDHLLLTHYCSMGNQPRMRAQVPAGEIKALDFAFVDATNMAKPTDAHMDHVTFTFQDKGHFSQVWTLRKEGQDMPMTFTLARKK